jgi:hypothetical protein
MKLSDFAVYESNPFEISGVALKHIIKKVDSFEVVNTSTGEVEMLHKAAQQVSFNKDSLMFKKVFDGAIDDVKDFTPAALKIWCYLLKNLSINKDEVIINMQECMEYSGYDTKSPLYKGICELIAKKFIARRVGVNTYFINPDKFFNGKRA